MPGKWSALRRGAQFVKRYGPRAIVAGAKIANYIKGGLRAAINRRIARKAYARSLNTARLARRGGVNTVKGNPSGIATLSKWSIYKKPSSQVMIMKKAGARNTYVDQQTLRLDTKSGFQEHAFFAHLENNILYDTIKNIPGGAVTAASGGQPFNRMVLENYSSEMLFANATNVSCELEIYDLVLKRDVKNNESYQQDLSGGSTVLIQWSGQPTQAIQAGISNATGSQPDTPPYNYTLIGSVPSDSLIFSQYFTVAQRKLVQLPQGGCHRHMVKQQLNKVVSRSDLSRTGAYGWKGLTCFTYYRVRGYPVSSAEDGANITTSSCSIDAVMSRRFSYTYVVDNTQTLRYTDNLLSLVPGDEAIINVGSGQVDKVQSAT